MKVLIGGYTKKNSQGIYELTLKEERNVSLGKAQSLIKLSGPTYFQKDHNLIFTIKKDHDQGGIGVYLKTDHGYQEVDCYLTNGASPAYLGINQEKNLIYTANYHTGVLSIFNYNKNGQLTLLAKTTHKAQTLGPKPEQADGAHPHFFDETPAGNLVSCDLGNDQVDFYHFADQKLIHLATYQNEPGFGSRHLVFDPSGKYFYVVGELSSQINLVKFDEKTWNFTSLATYKTIPRDYHDHNGAAAIKISQDGKFIYVSNRGHNSITVFSVLKDHTLKLNQRVATFGEFPRDFNWDEQEKYVVVANQNTNNATLYSRNSNSGSLTPLQKNIAVPEGTRVLFTK